MPTSKDILQAIADHLGVSVEDIENQNLLREDLGLGPLELNDLLADLSNKFDVTFDPEDIEHLKRVEDLVTLVEDDLIG